MGKMMDKYQGESENHIRSALRTAEAVAPCIFWIS
jgi:SpoVK/Ycf46/Vps4 family AAA+-type ATPase